ncbi:enhancer of mRNA decapping, partial [Elasticomyces elasticus]
MAEAFIGMTVQVVLASSPSITVHGKVADIIAGQVLKLENGMRNATPQQALDVADVATVYFPSSGDRLDTYDVPAGQVGDLKVIEHIPTPSTASASAKQQATLPPQPSPVSVRQKNSFVDPAILSFGRTPPPVSRHVPPSAAAPAATEAPAIPVRLKPLTDEAPVASEDRDLDEASVPMRTFPNGKAPRRSKRGNKHGTTPDGKTARVYAEATISTEVSRNGNDMTGSVRSKKGWRSTPLLQESPGLGPAMSPSASGKRQGRRSQVRRSEAAQNQNGWATEDATDIHDMGDFDFEANLSKFDKKTVFDKMRNEDTTADEDRLVSHNRLPAHARPGTYGGKNLHPTENVLSPQLKPTKYRSSELGSTSDADTELNSPTGRSSTMRMSASSKKVPTRSNSLLFEESFNRSTSSIPSRIKRTDSIAPSHANPNRVQSPSVASSLFGPVDHPRDPPVAEEPQFQTSPNEPCSTISPQTLASYEELAI